MVTSGPRDPGTGRSSDFLLKCHALKGQDPVRLKHYALDKGLWADGLAQRVEPEVGGGKMPSGRGWKQMRWAEHTGSGRARVRVSVSFPPAQGHVHSSGRGWAEGPGIGQPRVGENVPTGLQDRTLLEKVLGLSWKRAVFGNYFCCCHVALWNKMCFESSTSISFSDVGKIVY